MHNSYRKVLLATLSETAQACKTLHKFKQEKRHLTIVLLWVLVDYMVSTKECFCFMYLVECLFESSNRVHMEQATWTCACACACACASSVTGAGAGAGAGRWAVAGAGALPWWPRCHGWWLSCCWCPPPRPSPPPGTWGGAWLPRACYCPGPAAAHWAVPSQHILQQGGSQVDSHGQARSVQGGTAVTQVTEEDWTEITAVPNCPYAEL